MVSSFSANLDPDKPMHVQIERWLADAIRYGELRPGDRLPAEREFAADLGVSRMTLRQALSELANRELVVRSGGRSGGTFVATPKVECDLTGLSGFRDQLRRSNVRPGVRLLLAEHRPASPKTATALDIRTGEPVFWLRRLRLASGDPLAVEQSYFPAKLFPGLLERDLTHGLRAMLAQSYGFEFARSFETLSPDAASEPDARALGLVTGCPLMKLERIAYTSSGLALEHAVDLFHPERAKIALWSEETAVPVGR